ncbi:glycosyltransferase [Paractinoplanes abujensis]|uniref:Glycosyltransferase involved in cell wall biosynthesis n=1 Tax=Paractinoplanes abujensis TaxID=882441 RepID=A0A7W7G2B1_9ACTN|nr:glycosyltransferase [Actinoplanes abujensis]MBB4693504.1 glycosyltransferase involved in cell wall biosynthesis [Actinoplanes abujensis]
MLDVLRDDHGLAHEAARATAPSVMTVLAAAVDGDDDLAAVAAVHGIGAVVDDEADAVLSRLLSHPRTFLREHAAWVLQSRLPRLDAIDRLIRVVAAGGFSGMLAQRTLESWGGSAGAHIAAALLQALAVTRDPQTRGRLVETLGLVFAEQAEEAVRLIALDPDESMTARIRAVAALGDRPGNPESVRVIESLRVADGELGAVVRLAAVDLGLLAGSVPAGGTTGLRIAQIFLHADIDSRMSRAGAGDNGGIATLLVRLGDKLAAQPGIERVLTISRGPHDRALEALTRDEKHVLGAVPMPGPAVTAAGAWPARVAVRRGIRRLLRAHRIDAVHLRMAEVGSLAAAEVAAEMNIPVVFTLAPDPHATIDALERTGGLRRDNFGLVDEREHFWFRARLVQRLAAKADHVVLFPRPDLARDLERLMGIDIADGSGRYSVVAEGIDLDVSRAAAADLADRADSPALDELDALVGALPPHRHGLPLAISVGRLHRVKGMATLVRAWARDPALREQCNLMIVGGDLVDPSPDEREQLELIAEVLREYPEASAGLVMPGHRPNDVVARWLAAVHAGRASLIARGGVYVCASLKEEFGLALLEALAAGLVVVGPDAGGPATYIEHGVTGILAPAGDPATLTEAVLAALDLARRPAASRVERARARISDGLTIDSMAGNLAAVYASVTAEEHRS